MLVSYPKASEEYCSDRSFRVFRVSVVSSYRRSGVKTVGRQWSRVGSLESLHLLGHSHVDRRVLSDCAAVQDPGIPTSPAQHDPQEFGPPFDAYIRKRVQDRAGIARLAQLEYHFAQADDGPVSQGIGREAGHGHIFTEIAGLNRPAFRLQAG